MPARIYTLKEASRALHLSEKTLRRCAENGTIHPIEIKGGLYLDESALMGFRERYFDEHHGEGSFREACSLLSDPCFTYSALARMHGVTREGARKWSERWFPHFGTASERQKLCTSMRRHKRLFSDDLFRTFYRHARPFFSREDFEFVQKSDGQFSTKLVKLAGRSVRLTERVCSGYGFYTINRPHISPDFLYSYLSDVDAFLFFPGDVIPRQTSYVDTPSSRYYQYRNNFGTLLIELAEETSAA